MPELVLIVKRKVVIRAKKSRRMAQMEWRMTECWSVGVIELEGSRFSACPKILLILFCVWKAKTSG
jgi:hypothetical protein